MLFLNQKKFWIFSLLAPISLAACSGGDGSAETKGASKTPTVLIERERRMDDEQAYIQQIRQTMQACQLTKSEVARATGATYNAQSDELSDAAIAKLDTEVTLEVFDGPRYAQIKTISQLDGQRFGPGPGQSCRPTAVRTKTVHIRQDACNSTDVVYDLSNGGGTRTQEQASDCMQEASRPNSPEVLQGERMAIQGAALECRWSEAPGERGRLCLLEPWYRYPGTRLHLVVATQPGQMGPARNGAEVTFNAVRFSEHPLRVEVGQPLPKGVFDEPADARNFPAPS